MKVQVCQRWHMLVLRVADQRPCRQNTSDVLFLRLRAAHLLLTYAMCEFVAGAA